MDLTPLAALSLDSVGSALAADLDALASQINSHRPLPPDLVRSIDEDLLGERVQKSAAIEGNTLTIRETREIPGHRAAHRRREAAGGAGNIKPRSGRSISCRGGCNDGAGGAPDADTVRSYDSRRWIVFKKKKGQVTVAQTGAESTYMDFPDDWKLEEASGVGPFTTRTVHRRPDGSKYEWEARKHRRRGGGPSSGGKSRWLRFFRSGQPYLVGRRYVRARLAAVYGGGFCIPVSGYRRARPGVLRGRLVVLRRGHAFYGWCVPGTARNHKLQQPSATQTPERFPEVPVFAWQPKSLGYVSALVMLVGAVAFNVETFFAISRVVHPGAVNWLTTVPAILGGYPLCRFNLHGLYGDLPPLPSVPSRAASRGGAASVTLWARSAL